MQESVIWPDVVILVIIAGSMLISFLRGFVREFISLATWIFAAWLAYLLSKPLSSLITFVKTPSLKIIISFIIVFVLIIFFGAIINYIAGKIVRKTPFSLPDRVLGMGFGFIRGLAIVTLIVLLLKLTPFPKDDWWKNSFSMRQFDGMATWVKNQFPEAVAKQFD